MKNTKIVATIGLASGTPEMLKKISENGVNIFRLNFSHGSYEEHLEKINHIRNQKLKGAILLDTKGPEIRTGELKGELFLNLNDKFTVSTVKGIYEETGKISVNYEKFFIDVEVNDTIVLDSGMIIAKAIKKSNGTDIEFEVVEGSGPITSKRHINLQGKDVSLPTVTEQDWKDIKFGVENKVDFIALSFARSAKDILDVKEFCAKNGEADIKVIAKIESFGAIENMEEIVEACDGIMVARGDLACEIPFTQVPKAQRNLVELCSYYEKPVIIATQMLLSMVSNITPTRAEVSDVANAVYDYVDAIMLSDETTKSEDPSHVVKTMASIAIQVEKDLAEEETENLPQESKISEIMPILSNQTKDVDGIIIISKDNTKLAASISGARLNMPLFVCTNKEMIKNQLYLFYGVRPVLMTIENDLNKNFKMACNLLKEDLTAFNVKNILLVTEESIDGESILTTQIRKFK